MIEWGDPEKYKVVMLTGMAGFIGYHLAERLVKDGWFVIGVDSLNDYYDVRLKYERLSRLGFDREEIEYRKLVKSRYDENEKCSFIKLNLEDTEGIKSFFDNYHIDVVCNLGAQAGVRYSIENPMAYVTSNIVGFTNLLEQSHKNNVENFVYASSSSVYGLNGRMPFSEHDATNHPVSFYAATKKCDELMAHVYSKLYNMPTTGLRFFTVYGPWGRPDMSPMLFADAIMHGKPIKVFNNGDMARDFTYIDDIIEGVVRVLKCPARPNRRWNPQKPDPATSNVPYRVYNIGSSSPVKLLDYIMTLETALGRKAIINMLPMQPGDVKETYCDISGLENDFGYKPTTKIEDGLKEFAKWYKEWDENSRIW